jgi:mxaK protein
MEKRIKTSNLLFSLLLLLGLAGSAFEGYQLWKKNQVNQALLAGKIITDEAFPYEKKFSSAYAQGNKQGYKHAVQTYGQLLDTSPPEAEQAKIQFNIANNLFTSGLIRRINDDGTLQDDARYAYTQAKLAYEQSLRLAPDTTEAKFNLSLLHVMMARGMNPSEREDSTMELSNLPIGLP